MVERLPRLLSVATVILMGVLVFEIVGLLLRRDPLDGVQAPTVPRWSDAETNAPASAATGIAPVASNPGTIHTHAAVSGTIIAVTGTNVPPAATNAPTSPDAIPAVAAANTNVPSAITNNAAEINPPVAAGTAPTAAPMRPTGTSGPMGVALPVDGPPGTSRRSRIPPPPPSPLIQARMDRITQSEVLAPVLRPPPMALLGIAGLDAFVRTPDGQSTLLREGGESGGITLLRIGTNRVLIEHAGEKKELMIYDGFGGESLLPK